MKEIAIFKSWIKFINIAWTFAIIISALYSINYATQPHFSIGMAVIVSMFFIAAMAFKSIMIGIAHTLVIISQDLNVLAKADKIREAERNKRG